MTLKNMKLGNKISTILFFFIFFCSSVISEEKILSSTLLNLDELKPSYEDIDDEKNTLPSNQLILNKKKKPLDTSSSNAKLIGLDKITAKTTEISINLGEVKKFGPLEIKVLKCAKLKTNNLNNNVAYLQVKDLTENENDKVFIFNGWTFSSDPTITPFDHAIYDLQLISCSNV